MPRANLCPRCGEHVGIKHGRADCAVSLTIQMARLHKVLKGKVEALERLSEQEIIARPSTFDRESIEHILKNPKGSADWFGAHVIRLVSRADLWQRERIRIIYPEHVAAYEEWYYGDMDTAEIAKRSALLTRLLDATVEAKA